MLPAPFCCGRSATLPTTSQLLPSPAAGFRSTATMSRICRPPYYAFSSVAKFAQYSCGTGTIGPCRVPYCGVFHSASVISLTGAGSGTSVTVFIKAGTDAAGAGVTGADAAADASLLESVRMSQRMSQPQQVR